MNRRVRNIHLVGIGGAGIEPAGLKHRPDEGCRRRLAVRPGHRVLFMGAGDVNRWIEPLLEALGPNEGGRDD